MALFERLRITRGSDRSPIIRLRSTKTKDPLDLTGATAIQVVFPNKERGKLTLSNSVIPATRAAAIKGVVTFQAVNLGAVGNLISLLFNGTDDIATVVEAWNSTNPSNTVSHNGSDTAVLAAGTLQLTGGYDLYTPVQVYGDPKLGKIMITLLDKDTEMLKAGENQSFKIVIDFGQHPGGSRHIGLYENKLDVKDVQP